MGSPFDKFLPAKRGNVPVKRRDGTAQPPALRPGDGRLGAYRPPQRSSGEKLPNASVIYGLASSVLFVIAVYNLIFTPGWFSGIMILILAGILLGYAVYFLRRANGE